MPKIISHLLEDHETSSATVDLVPELPGMETADYARKNGLIYMLDVHVDIHVVGEIDQQNCHSVNDLRNDSWQKANYKTTSTKQTAYKHKFIARQCTVDLKRNVYQKCCCVHK